MDSSIIKKFRSIPSNFVFYRIIWSCQLKNFLRSKYCCLKISLLDSSSTSYIREVYFLPWIFGMSHTKNNSLPSICVNWCSYKIKSSILETSLCSNMGCSPISWIVLPFVQKLELAIHGTLDDLTLIPLRVDPGIYTPYSTLE